MSYMMKVRPASDGGVLELTIPAVIARELEVKPGKYFEVTLAKDGFHARYVK
jgi:hypothetical protein